MSSSSSSEAIRALMSSVKQGVRASNALPDSSDWSYLQSFAAFRRAAGVLQERLLTVLGEEGGVALEEMSDDTERFRAVVDAVDGVLEKVDLSLDAALGLNKSTLEQLMVASSSSSSSSSSSTAAAASASSGASSVSSSSSSSSRTMMKPQLKFSYNRLDNFARVWKPILQRKPHAKRSLEESLKVEPANVMQSPPLNPSMQSHLSALGISKPRRTPSSSSSSSSSPGSAANNKAQAIVKYPHPYQHEIETLEYDEKLLRPCKEQLYVGMDKVKCEWIDTREQLEELASTLEVVPEFAVDLEHHNFRSYYGFVCLMQVSTRTHDYLIDTLAVREHMHLLLDAFTDPKIVKVLHGADRDIEWLQRDFGLYIVNLFDTGQCSRVMEMPRFSLAYLLEHYCRVLADKKYQTEDWRVRPLSREMLHYAQQDTHYLLYIYDRMRNELLNMRNGQRDLKEVLRRSRQVSLKTFEPSIVSDKSHLRFCSRNGLVFTDAQMRVLQALYRWRDQVARREDESVGYVMPNRTLIKICTELPLDSQQLLATCRPITPLLRQHVHAVVKLIVHAKAEPMSPAFPVASATTSPGMRGLPLGPPMLVESSHQQMATPMAPEKFKARLTEPSSDSPAMNTDKLYDMAGWIGPDTGPEGPPGVRLFDATGLHSAGQENQQQAATATATATSNSVLFATPGSSKAATKRKHLAMDTPGRFKKQADRIRQALHGEGTVSLGHFIVSSAVEIAQRRKEEEQQVQPLQQQQSRQLAQREFEVVDYNDKTRTPETGERPSATEVQDGVPMSLRQIYKMSNRNRQQQKQASSKTDKGASASESTRGADSKSSMSSAASLSEIFPSLVGSKRKEMSSPGQFMNEIGWEQQRNQQQQQRQGGDRQGGEREEEQEQQEEQEVSQSKRRRPNKKKDSKKKQKNFRSYDYADKAKQRRAGSSNTNNSTSSRKGNADDVFDPYANKRNRRSGGRGGRSRSRGGRGGRRGGRRR
eukprot:TRINITY_DN66381_c6_g2_i1.p1 TRINITY_DN66381_c6_g2~~TRINITY_DN66381_c6_g2_i1.p1  ORF type:complete len:985 (-),score=486.26 TRINITY_DN66381_c6_g2_i1:81-3035(-)